MVGLIAGQLVGDEPQVLPTNIAVVVILLQHASLRVETFAAGVGMQKLWCRPDLHEPADCFAAQLADCSCTVPAAQ